MASPIITTVVDAASLLILFSLARWYWDKTILEERK